MTIHAETEIDQIIHSDHSDPFHILGLHLPCPVQYKNGIGIITLCHEDPGGLLQLLHILGNQRCREDENK